MADKSDWLIDLSVKNKQVFDLNNYFVNFFIRKQMWVRKTSIMS